jgi:WD40 repeat protein
MKFLKIAAAILLLLAGAFGIVALAGGTDGRPPGAIPASGAELTAAPVARFVHHQGEARDMVFLPDGTMFAAGTDGRIEHVDAHGAVRGAIVHEGGVTWLTLSPDGSLLASAGYDRTVRLWRVADGRPAGTLSGHEGTVWTLAWSPDGQWLASAGEDRTIRIWRARDLALVHVLRGHELNIWAVRFGPDSRLLASGSFDHSIRLWDVTTGRMVRRLPGHDQAVVSVAFSPDGRLLASGGDDSTVRIWRLADGAQIRTLTGGSSHVYAVAFSPDGRWLASGGRARSGFWTLWHQLTGGGAKGPAVRLWRVADGAPQAALEHSDDVMSLAWSRDGRMLAAASADGSNAIWRLAPAH